VGNTFGPNVEQMPPLDSLKVTKEHHLDARGAAPLLTLLKVNKRPVMAVALCLYFDEHLWISWGWSFLSLFFVWTGRQGLELRLVGPCRMGWLRRYRSLANR
jgi:hypothetical protein